MKWMRKAFVYVGNTKVDTVGQFCDNECNQISWLGVFHSLLKFATNYHEDAQTIDLRRISLEQKWILFKQKKKKKDSH